MNSLLEEEEPVFSRLLQVNELLPTQAQLLSSLMNLGVGEAAGARPRRPETRPGKEEAGEERGR